MKLLPWLNREQVNGFLLLLRGGQGGGGQHVGVVREGSQDSKEPPARGLGCL